jgi:spermidine dehydrogenase
MSITRRDFLNGVALSIAAGLTPAAQLNAQPQRYPPALTGMRGQYDGSFEVAHALAREGRTFPVDGVPIDEDYDLVVVGGGISGLSAAWFYRRARPSARILILDNLDDFGGHAKRNEFTLDGRRLIGYGGSQSLQSPNALYSPVAKGLLRDLGIDIARFETAFERGFYPSLRLSRGIFFNREAFGRDLLVGSEPGNDGEATGGNAQSWANFVLAFPVSDLSKRQLTELYGGWHDSLRGKSVEEKREILKRTSYRDYLTKVCGYSD